MSDTAPSVALDVEGLRSGYHGVTVLKGLDFAVGDEIFAVLGANGAGKTTLLATLARLIPLMAALSPAELHAVAQALPALGRVFAPDNVDAASELEGLPE